MIDWRKSYRLGIPEIDGEHLVLLALLNQIEMDHIFGNCSPPRDGGG